MGRAEKTLVAQANTLDAIFNELARRAALNMGEYLNATEIYLGLALKAQSQCRATLETLAVIKNPPNVAFVKQANIAHNQQVNNAPAIPSRARQIENPQNYWRCNPMNGWTPERRARQSALIRHWKPWEQSTGPRTPGGKVRVSRNADKGGTRGLLRDLSRALREQARMLNRRQPRNQ